jgi:asparagine synthase (glutamine-hydrolysing)
VFLLLSGGLDSSLITAIAARLQAESGKNYSLRIGLDANAPDVAAARKVAAFESTTKFTLLSKTESKLFKK